MPQKFWSKSNRSHNSVDTSSSGQPSPVPSALAVNNELGAQRFTNNHPQQPSPNPAQQPQLSPHPQQQQQQQQSPQPDQYRQQFPQRSASQANRLSAHLDQVLPQQQNYQQQPGPPQSSPGLDNHRASYQPQPQPQYPAAQVQVQPEPKKQSLRSRIANAAGLSGHKDDDAAKQAHKNGINRRQSVRKSDPRLQQQYNEQEANRLQASQQWHQHSGSRTQLAPSHEQDEDNLDPFLQQDNHDTPQPPPKDLEYRILAQQHREQQQQLAQQHQQQLQQQQQFGPNSHQEQYNRPPLGRVSTEGSYQTQGQGGVDHYSPDQHQGQGLQQPQQQQTNSQQPQYQSYQPQPHPQTPDEYQAFNPQTVPSPLLANSQLHGQGQELTQPPPYNYQYQQQQQQVSSPNQAQSPQTTSPQNAHYPPQQQFLTQSQPHSSQDQQQPQPQIGRTPSQQQPRLDLQHPQATRQIPQIVQQGQQIDTQQLQQLRPPSQQAQLAPPSPLQQSQTYQPPNEPSQNRPPQASDSPPQTTTPAQQGQDSMAPAGQSAASRNTLRKVNEGGQQPGPPTRESSLLQPAGAQGQPLGQPPVSPGLATFDANVVPTASQGQPFRGDKQGQQGQSGEMGRATPPPRPSVADMSDEEIEKMMKEHEVLREKYQKVKRYFFEQQTQVHQLQNTLANQRLSLSRTSWDDSEYATRFNRLDGLIAQLSFSIRKDWKSIPQWLHVVVNKTAVETGKQEMTAVGRAFISHWLVENIFEKYFHPDLEPNFSTQLQMIALNIRKFAPACHSTEDEDSLAAKVINWRLATLEGLADVLRAPQAASNRQTLTESLNEKLIASLQMHLNDPAPPDLNGGVPMIVELAVSIAQHLPLESREVHIEYFMPGHSIVQDFMKLESGIPALTAPIAEPEEADRASLRSVASKVQEDSSSIEQEQLAQQQQAQQQQQQQQQQAGQPPKEDKKRGMFGFGGSKKPTQNPANLGKRESSLGQGGSQQSLTQNPPGSSSGPKDEPPPRVRLAVGVAVQIRGKSILIKAPVYST